MPPGSRISRDAAQRPAVRPIPLGRADADDDVRAILERGGIGLDQLDPLVEATPCDLAAAAIERLSIEVDTGSRGAGMGADDAQQELGPPAPELDDVASGRERERVDQPLGALLVERRVEDELRVREASSVSSVRHGRRLRCCARSRAASRRVQLSRLEPPRPVAADLSRAGSYVHRCRAGARPGRGRSRARRASSIAARRATSVGRPETRPASVSVSCVDV